MSNPLSKQQKLVLIATLKANNGNVSKTARETDYSAPTIRKYRDELEEQAGALEPDEVGFEETEEVSRSSVMNAMFHQTAENVAKMMMKQELSRIQTVRMMAINRLAQVIPATRNVRDIAGAIKILDDMETIRIDQNRAGTEVAEGSLAKAFLKGLEDE